MLRVPGRYFFPLSVWLLLYSSQIQAQDPSVQQLENTLRARDNIILELLERVEALERRVGVQPVTKKPVATTTPDSTPTVDPQRARNPEPNRASAPGAVVVDEAAAERALERSLTRSGALLLPPGILEIEPGIAFSRRESATPSLITTANGAFVGNTEFNANSLTANLALRLGLPWHSQLELGVPYRWREVERVSRVGFAATGSSHQSAADFGDVRIGLAKTLFREGLWRPDLVGRITWDTDSGHVSDNGLSLGGGFHELQVSLTAIKRQDPIAFVGGISFEHSFEKDQLQPGSTVAANFGGFIALSPQTSIRLGIAASYQDQTKLSGRTIDGSDRVVGSFILGGSTLLAPGTLLNLSAGIGLTDDADDLTLSLSLPFRLGRPLYG